MSTAGSADPSVHRGWWSTGRSAARVLRVSAISLVAAVLLGASPAGAFPQLQSTGSSFAGVAIAQWVGQASALDGFNINFQVTGSVFGLNSFAQNQVDFGASDIPYSSGQADSSPTQPFQYLPDVAGALAFMYNLQGVDGQQIKNLVLNASTLDGIFSGKITFWDDSAIKNVNPPQVAENLPHTTIIPVYREDASGENYLFSDYLLHQDTHAFEAYQSAVIDPTANQPSATWPVPQAGQPPPAGYPNASSMQGQNGSDGVANYVSALSSQGSIGYLETAYAIQHNFPVASLVNASGTSVQPTSVNDATALEKAVLFADLTQDLTNVYANPLPNAYPVSAYSYLVTPCSPSLAAAQKFACTGPQGSSPLTSDRGSELGQFINFLACDGQEKMALLGYSPLPPNLVQEDFNSIGRLNGGQQPAAPTAANCHNPYVDGEVALPGEPQINTSVSDVHSAGAQQVTQQAAAQTALAKAQAQASAAAAASAAATRASGAKASGKGASSNGANGSSAPGSPHGGARTRSQGRSLGDPYSRFDSLKQTAADVGAPPLLGPVLLWCALLAVALVGPSLGRQWWRRHSARASRADVGSVPLHSGDAR